MSYVCDLVVILIFFAGYFVVTSRYLVVAARYLVLLLDTAHYWWLLLVLTFSMNGSALVLSIHSKAIKFQCFLISVDFKEHLSVTASSRCSWPPIETVNCFYCNIHFQGNKLKQINFFTTACT